MNWKGLFLNSLPEPVLTFLRKRRYFYKLRAQTEADERDFPPLKYLISPGDFAIDVGANFGVFTKYLSSLVGEGGRVVAVEPVSATFAALQYCVKSLGLANVELVHCALSDRNELVTMEVPAYHYGGRNYYEAKIVEAAATSSRGFTVESKTIDQLFADASAPVAFLKIDVEGHELFVLRGAATTLDRFSPGCLIEVSGDPDGPQDNAAQVFEFLGGKGYAPYWFDGKSLRRRRAGERSTNFFFLKEQHLNGLHASRLLADPGVSV